MLEKIEAPMKIAVVKNFDESKKKKCKRLRSC